MKVIKKQLNSHDCIVCGMDNKLGLKAEFYNVEGDKVATRVTFKDEHQSYPGRTHGGMITALLDELIGRAIWVKDETLWGVTIKLEMTYRKPVPLNTELLGVGWLVGETTRTFTGRGQILDLENNVLAECEAVYMKLPISKITDDDEHLAMFMTPGTRKEI